MFLAPAAAACGGSKTSKGRLFVLLSSNPLLSFIRCFSYKENKQKSAIL